MTGLCVDQVERLAAALWRSVGEQADMSVQSWLMAEMMIRELTYMAGAFGVSIHDMVREQAYYLWEQAGREAGRAVDFWLTAERQVWDAIIPPSGQTRVELPRRSVDPW